MSQNDEREVLSETEAGAISEDVKLVPVSESIRYRKRAQSAEKEVEALAEQLTQAKSEAGQMVEELNDARIERELTVKLVSAGAVDLETAMLVAKAKMAEMDEQDPDGVIERLKKEKVYLFGGEQGRIVAAKRTAGAKDREMSGQALLSKAAKKAAKTGSRTDLQDYLKLRRSFVSDY